MNVTYSGLVRDPDDQEEVRRTRAFLITPTAKCRNTGDTPRHSSRDWESGRTGTRR
jgi:hypothetical protein